MNCPRCGALIDGFPCPQCGFPVNMKLWERILAAASHEIRLEAKTATDRKL